MAKPGLAPHLSRLRTRHGRAPYRHLLEGGGADATVLPDLRAQPVAAGACSLCLRVPGPDRAGDAEQSPAERD